MRIRQAALVVAIVAQLVAALALVISVHRDRDVSIDEDELAAAQAAFQRRLAAPASAPALPDPEPRAQRPEPAAEPEPRPEPRRQPRRERIEVERSRPTLASQREQEPQDEQAESETPSIDHIRQPFDQGRFLEALELADEFLQESPDHEWNEYVRRVAVTSACAVGELDTAQQYYDEMSERDQRTLERRCARYGVEF